MAASHGETSAGDFSFELSAYQVLPACYLLAGMYLHHLVVLVFVIRIVIVVVIIVGVHHLGHLEHIYVLLGLEDVVKEGNCEHRLHHHHRLSFFYKIH